MRVNAAGARPRRSMREVLVQHLPPVRITAAASLLTMIGCTGLIDAPKPTKAEIAQQLWIEKALPALRDPATTCEVCHGGDTARAKVEFLVGNDELAIRDKLLSFDPPVISYDSPSSSRLLTKGQHEGGPLVGPQKDAVLEWIEAEKEAKNAKDNPGQLNLRTAEITLTPCVGQPDPALCPVNEIALDDVGNGAGIPGAKITFVAQAVSTGIYLNRLKLVPGTAGAYIEHPLFVSIPADGKSPPIADTLDRYFSTKMNLMAGATAEQQQIAGGVAAFPNFPSDGKLTIYFRAVNNYQPETTGGAVTGCKKLATFDAGPRAAFNTSCAGCHTAGNAKSAVDMTGVNAAGSQDACNHILQRAVLADIPNSSIFVVTTPGYANHPFRFPDTTTLNNFKNIVSPWLAAERDAP